MKEPEKCLDSQLWHACAGSMVQIPPVNSKVFYFPQGHAEHCLSAVDFIDSPKIPPLVFSRVAAVKFLADSETDEVYAKITLVPISSSEIAIEDDLVLGSGGLGPENAEKPVSFAKTLTQSDANNGGGFSVPRYCAETIFPKLDFTADPPVQTVTAKDVQGEIWKFRHIYRGTPRRHLLTTGWSSFVNQKKLVAGDSIVFLRAENGELCVGIRRAKRGIGNGVEFGGSGWNPGNPYGGFTSFLREEECKMMRNGGNVRAKGKVRAEAVLEAAAMAAKGQPFEVIYYPRAGTPEFCVKASAVRATMRINWCSGMRFKMPFETEDSSRISWFMGTVASVQVADPIFWPNSPWRLLQVSWDEPDLLQNVKRVSPWLVELVSNMPIIHFSPFAPPRKKLRFPSHLDFPLDGQFPMPSFSGNPLGPSSPSRYLSDNAPAGIQGARQAQFGVSLSDLRLNNKLQSGLFMSGLQRFDPPSRISETTMPSDMNGSENLSCLLTIGSSSPKEKSDTIKKPQFLLFGQLILTEQQISQSSSTESESESALCTGHCKVFMDSEDVGRTLDLSALGSYEELYRRLANMFGLEMLELSSHVLYRDATGAVKRTGDEPFSDFMKTAKRLTITMRDSSSESVGRFVHDIAGMRNAENGLDGRNKTGPLSIFA